MAHASGLELFTAGRAVEARALPPTQHLRGARGKGRFVAFAADNPLIIQPDRRGVKAAWFSREAGPLSERPQGT